ncbi:hypothetical protein [Sinorhizobium phage phiM5]|nr:hypothetical protein [Sinorhizobium phage phiM5]
MKPALRTKLFVIRETSLGRFLRSHYKSKDGGLWTLDVNNARTFNRKSDAVQCINSNGFGRDLDLEVIPLTAITGTSAELLDDLMADLQIAYVAGFKAGSSYDGNVMAPGYLQELAELEWNATREGIIAAAMQKGAQSNA